MSDFGPTVVAYQNTVTGRDGDGNDILTPTPIDVVVMAVWPRGSTEDDQGGVQVTDGQVVLLAGTSDLTAIDYMTVDGIKYELDGDPGRFTHPVDGTAVTEINLKNWGR